jgi:hypothetical protein
MAIESFPSRSHRIQSQALFSWALIGATTLPFMAFATNLAAAVPALAFLLMLGGTHVVATGYLFTDPAIRRFCLLNRTKMIIVPSVILIAAFAVFSRPGPLFTVAALTLFLFQTWHFGAQNIGVASFISLSERGRPLAPFEKTVIKAGIWVGILGVLKAMSPDFVIGASSMQLPDEATAAIGFLYEIGKMLALPTTGAALWLAISAWRSGQPLFSMVIFLSVTFLFPMYLTSDYTIGFTSFVTAHGLQYLIFLAVHSTGHDPAHPVRARIIAPAILFLFMVVGLSFDDLKSLHTASLQSLGLAVVFAITLVHFWVDRFIWRMKDKERARWIKDRFGAVIEPRSCSAEIVRSP